MKFGFRKPSLKKSIAARASIKRAVRARFRAPRGYGWVTNPKRAAYNRVYHRTTRSCSSCLTIIVFLLFLLIAGIMWII